MKQITEAARQTDVCAEVDVLVCGGGSAGVAAAVAPPEAAPASSCSSATATSADWRPAGW